MVKYSAAGRKRSRSRKRGRKIPLKHATRARKRPRRMSTVARRRVSRVAKAAAASLIKSYAERKTLVVNQPFRCPSTDDDVPLHTKLRYWPLGYGKEGQADSCIVNTAILADDQLQRAFSIDNKNVFCYRPHDWILARNPDVKYPGNSTSGVSTAIDQFPERFGVSYRNGVHVNLNSLTIRGILRGIDHEKATGPTRVRIVMFETKSSLPHIGATGQKTFQGKSLDPGQNYGGHDGDVEQSRSEEAVFYDNNKGRSWYHDKWNMKVVKKVYFDKKFKIGKHGLIYDLEESKTQTTPPTGFLGFTIFNETESGYAITKNKAPNLRNINIYHNFGPMGKRLTYQSENSSYSPDQTNQNIFIACCLDTGVPCTENLPFSNGLYSTQPWPFNNVHPNRFVDHCKLQLQLAYTDLG